MAAETAAGASPARSAGQIEEDLRLFTGAGLSLAQAVGRRR
ncbi:hypothetical protein ACWGIV_01360 [Streptomyces sp. NPDC054844]